MLCAASETIVLDRVLLWTLGSAVTPTTFFQSGSEHPSSENRSLLQADSTFHTRQRYTAHKILLAKDIEYQDGQQTEDGAGHDQRDANVLMVGQEG